MESKAENENVEVVDSACAELRILVTDEDKYGTDIMAMSNFYDGYINELKSRIKTNPIIEYVEEIPAGDIGILSEFASIGDMILKGKYSYIPDFDSLPEDIKKKFKEGVYSLGESKQVDGNLRAVILDENNVRVKDVTLKKVRNQFANMDNVRSITNQLQLRQISAKLDSIEMLQEFQIARDRDRDIKTPFLLARQNILWAQEAKNETDQRTYLEKANDLLSKAIYGAYTDLETSSEFLAKLTSRPFFQSRKHIDTYMNHIAEDLQVATKFVGAQLQIATYLGKPEIAESVYEDHKHILQSFVKKGIGSKGNTAAMIMQMNYPYNDSNRDFWFDFSEDVKPLLISENAR